jgi:cobalt-zinc-cadmium efflux system membrane fusion protein
MNKNPLLTALVLLGLAAMSGCKPSTPPDQLDSETARPARSAEHAEQRIDLSESQIRASGITVMQAGQARIRQTLTLYGSVAPNAERVREVTARYPGIVRSIAKRIGDSVKEGETLATVESNESLRTYPVTAPLTGVITQRRSNPGEYSGEGVMFTVADLSTVWVELSIFPRDVAKVRVGQSVRIQSPDSGLSGEGKVVYVAPFGQSANQTLTARVLVDNAERHWAPGLYVTAEVTLAETSVAVAIRSNAIQTLDGGSVIFARDATGFHPVPVTLGRSDSEFTEVTAGLATGQAYAAANSFILKAELGKASAEHED